MNKSDFFYHLPESLIAQTPIYPRDNSRMLVYNKKEDSFSHKHFYELTQYLKKGDVLVINNTRVIPARIYGVTKMGAKFEVLLLKRLNYTDFECLVKPGKRFKVGDKVAFSDALNAVVLSETDFGGRVLQFIFEGVLEDILDQIGTMPLPPYIKEKLEDQERYQTVYSKDKGSSAAPTAGLHFTTELMQKVVDMGVEILEVTLNVGLGTFRPVKEDKIEDHPMHSEDYSISKEVAERILQAKSEGRRIIAVGTTTVRVLEATYEKFATLKEYRGSTDIFIYPPYDFKVIDGLITNFHLPESTLIMLISAFIGREKALSMYELAVENQYRFFSFGDATLLI